MITLKELEALKELKERSTPYEDFTVQYERIEHGMWTLSARSYRDPKADVELLLMLLGLAPDIIEHLEKCLKPEPLTPPPTPEAE